MQTRHLLYIFIQLFLITMALPCNRYPKIIGGNSGNATINQIDLFGAKLAAIGSTSDPSLSQIGFSVSSTGQSLQNAPFIAMFTTTQTALVWAKMATNRLYI